MRLEALKNHACLVMYGKDEPALVEKVSSFVVRHKGNIIKLDQYADGMTRGNFFQRVVFYCPDLELVLPELKLDMRKTLGSIGMHWRLTDQSKPKRMAILASKSDHCLMDLLWRQKRGMLPVTIPLVIANHTDHVEMVRSLGIPYYYVRSQKGPDKSESEARILELLEEANVHFVVLARYMQILSKSFLKQVGVPVINIHHSFLPAFIGANPYDRAKERGVKLIGATAHYVTEDLDEGPIIEQDVTRVNHTMTAIDLREHGAFVERSVLSRAVTWHAEDRVIQHMNQTIVFD